MNKILFTDVDGVLNCNNQLGLEEAKLDLLKYIVASTQCKLVLSSTWRRLRDQCHRLQRALLDRGMELEGKTPYLPGLKRGNEIALWLAAHPGWETFVIVDDDSDMGDLLPALIQTDGRVGLTQEIADIIIQKLNQTNQ